MAGKMKPVAIACVVLSFLVPAHAVGALCAERTYEERTGNPIHQVCTDPYVHPDRHQEGILRLVAIRDAIIEEVLWAKDHGVFSLWHESRLPLPACRQFLDDVISLDNIEVVTEGTAEWATFNVGRIEPRLDPNFMEWRLPEGREVNGYVVVRWRNSKEFLVRATRMCVSASRGKCTSLGFQFLDVHDRARPIACSAMTVGAPYLQNGKDLVTPIFLHVPGVGATRP